MLNDTLKKMKLEHDGIIFSRLDEGVDDAWLSALDVFAQAIAEDFISYSYENYQQDRERKQVMAFTEYNKLLLDSSYWNNLLDAVIGELGQAVREYAERPQFIKKVRRKMIAQKRQGK